MTFTIRDAALALNVIVGVFVDVSNTSGEAKCPWRKFKVFVQDSREKSQAIAVEKCSPIKRNVCRICNVAITGKIGSAIYMPYVFAYHVLVALPAIGIYVLTIKA